MGTEWQLFPNLGIHPPLWGTHFHYFVRFARHADRTPTPADIPFVLTDAGAIFAILPSAIPYVPTAHSHSLTYTTRGGRGTLICGQRTETCSLGSKHFVAGKAPHRFEADGPDPLLIEMDLSMGLMFHHDLADRIALRLATTRP